MDTEVLLLPAPSIIWSIAKSDWALGPWNFEPDRVEWRHRSGLPELIVRSNVTGSLCGYVGVPPSHPFYGADGSHGCVFHLRAADCESKTAHRVLREMREASRYMWLHHGGPNPDEMDRMWRRHLDPGRQAQCPHTPGSLLEVHGGITFADGCDGPICHAPQPGEPDKVWWFGFDTAHAGDQTPKMDAEMRRMGIRQGPRLDDTDSYRTLEYVRRETDELADELAGFKGRIYCQRCGRRRRLERLTCKCGSKGAWRVG